jgi:S-adenosyl methyltransferase
MRGSRAAQGLPGQNPAVAEGGQVTSGHEPAGEGVRFDASKPHMARVYDYWLGGKDNYAADRAVAEQVASAYPDIRAAVRAQRAFLARAVHYLVTEAGIRQFLDNGTGLASANNTHQVAQAAAQSRVVYVDNDRCKSGCAHTALFMLSEVNAGVRTRAMSTVAIAIS